LSVSQFGLASGLPVCGLALSLLACGLPVWGQPAFKPALRAGPTTPSSPSPAQQRPSRTASCTTREPHRKPSKPPGRAANPLAGAARAQLNGDAYLSATLAAKTY